MRPEPILLSVITKVFEMLLVIAGSRTAQKHHVLDAIQRYPWKKQISKVISGTAHGADRYGEVYARDNGIEVVKFPADWDQYGMSAGPRRNREMAQNADGLLAIWDGRSKGTQNMISNARKFKVPKIMIYFFEDNRIEFDCEQLDLAI